MAQAAIWHNSCARVHRSFSSESTTLTESSISARCTVVFVLLIVILTTESTSVLDTKRSERYLLFPIRSSRRRIQAAIQHDSQVLGQSILEDTVIELFNQIHCQLIALLQEGIASFRSPRCKCNRRKLLAVSTGSLRYELVWSGLERWSGPSGSSRVT